MKYYIKFIKNNILINNRIKIINKVKYLILFSLPIIIFNCSQAPVPVHPHTKPPIENKFDPPPDRRKPSNKTKIMFGFMLY